MVLPSSNISWRSIYNKRAAKATLLKWAVSIKPYPHAETYRIVISDATKIVIFLLSSKFFEPFLLKSPKICHFFREIGGSKKNYVYFCNVFRKRHNILFAHSPLELPPQKVNGQYQSPRGLRLKRRLPIGD